MKDFDQLKNIWQQQENTTLPDVNIIVNKSKKYRNQYNQKIIIQLVSFAIAILVIGWVAFTIQFKQITTYIGIVLILLCIIVFSILRFSLIQKLNAINFTSNPNIALTQLHTVYKFQKLINTKLTRWYFLLMSIALGLYFIEVMNPLSLKIKVIAISLTLLWMLISYFYLGKRQVEKENNRIQKMIDSVEEIISQYDK